MKAGPFSAYTTLLVSLIRLHTLQGQIYLLKQYVLNYSVILHDM